MQVVSMLLFEGAVIGVVGGSIGFAMGTAASSIVAPMLVSVSPPPMWDILPIVIGICIITGMIASIIPAKKALTVDPADVLRSV
ncbi:hypothetical protein SDC9_193902 [bioreactor metagenome]|uniref:ABC3 transporter permease C-terminal domain-containing protein n=1 Tax=bioreactor metagenome TaxID=1076179 RepID=A0A645I5Z8_9ZZZZ